MNVFLSWSGPRSNAVAMIFNEWLPLVLQNSKPWLSSDIPKGANWIPELTAKLADTTVGIVCLTNSNKEQPWILFEAGAVAKGLSESRVCTFLIDLKFEDVTPPLSMFQWTTPDHDQVLKMVRTLNAQEKPELRISEKVLEANFQKHWPDFESAFAKASKTGPSESKPIKRQTDDVLNELLGIARNLEREAIRNRPPSPLDFVEAASLPANKIPSHTWPFPGSSDPGTEWTRQKIDRLRNALVNFPLTSSEPPSHVITLDPKQLAELFAKTPAAPSADEKAKPTP